MAHCAKAVDLGLSVTPWDGLRQVDRVDAYMCMEAATADMRAELTSLRAENERLLASMRIVRNDLAALVPVPSAVEPQWPEFFSAADYQCLTLALREARAAVELSKEPSNG
jgi:hypothetical protein